MNTRRASRRRKTIIPFVRDSFSACKSSAGTLIAATLAKRAGLSANPGVAEKRLRALRRDLARDLGAPFFYRREEWSAEMARKHGKSTRVNYSHGANS